jgi:hypothetical protein
MSKMSIVRSIRNKSQDTEKVIKREAHWDSRFHLGKLPAYDSYSDSNCKNLE